MKQIVKNDGRTKITMSNEAYIFLSLLHFNVFSYEIVAILPGTPSITSSLCQIH